MEINRYIKDLLLEHDCVVIPGLGGFIGSAARSETQSVTKTINPPGKQISFNAQLQRNDGLLVHHIAFVEGVDYDEAEQGVQDFVKACRKRLEQNGLIIFPEVGKLMANAEGTLSFYSTPGRNLLQESFGLKPVHYRQTFDIVTKPTVETAPVSIPLQPVRNERNKASRFVSTYGVSIAAMLAIGIFIGQGLYFKPLALENFGFFKPESIFTSNTESPNTVQANIDAEPIAAGSLEVSGTLETITDVNIKETTIPVIENTKPDTETVKADTDATIPHITEISTNEVNAGYYIVMGAYSSKRNANNFIKEHSNLSGLVTIPSNGLFRVALPAGTVANEAYQLLEKQRQQENPAAWLVFNNL